MAQPATNPKIDELRSRLKAEPKSRLFYQLAEELRRMGQFAEAESVLRSGLDVYPTYLAAWVSLGRVLREQKNDAPAVEALKKALQLDPGNVVAARLLADAYLALGEKVEAIKKYKLVHAILPADEDLRSVIEQLERDLHPPVLAKLSEEEQSPEHLALWTGGAPQYEEPAPAAEESPFDRTVPPFEEASPSLGEDLRVEEATGDAEPMAAAHETSPFEEPVDGSTAEAVEIEAPVGIHIVSAPVAAEVPTPIAGTGSQEEAASTDSTQDVPAPETGDVASTLTMADLYLQQGLTDQARDIYERILTREPENAEARAKLAAISAGGDARIEKLERWMAKMTRRGEVGRV